MNWLDMTLGEVQQEMALLGAPKFRARQVYDWLHKGMSVGEMRNIPAELRGKMLERPLGGAEIFEKRTSVRGDTAKYLFLLQDGNIIEGVLMQYHHGNTLCISTQVGCRMGCTFCASTLEGLVRNLTPGEMLGQVLSVERERRGNTRNVTNVVLMGSGEPLDNYDNVVKFLRLVTGADGINISPRNISLSTCGLPDQIKRLARDIGVTLSVSLHAPEDKLRQSLMPVARAYSLNRVMDAAREYVAITGRRVIIEYALIDGVNDSAYMAQKLAELLHGLQCHVNLIPLNSVRERSLMAAGRRASQEFLEELTRLGVSATIRREMGADIEGACGQLRKGYIEKKPAAKGESV